LKQAIVFFFIFAILAGCDKSQVAKEAEALPVTNIITTGNWIMTYTESGSQVDLGTCLSTFSRDGKFVLNKNGTNFDGTWNEVKNENSHTLKLNLVTSDTGLLKTNGTWQVIIATSTHIDITDPDVAKRHTVHFNK
jgi:predicted secreted protein